MNPWLIAVGAYLAAQPVLCVVWARVMKSRRDAGGN